MRAVFFLVLLIGLGLLGDVTVNGSAAEWPLIAPGVWRVRATRTLSNGKEERWERTLRQCEDPTLLFKGYWGKATLDRAGCQFSSEKTAARTYRIDSECMLIGGAKSTGVATVTLSDERRFQLTVRIDERRSQVSAVEEGDLIEDCPR